MSAPLVFVLSAAGNGNGVYTGTFVGGASNAYAGMWVIIAGFTDARNNGTFQVTASGATTIATTNTGSVTESHAATATDFTLYTCLDAGGYPSTVVAVATSTGSQWSSRFSVLCKPDGSTRSVKLQLASAIGAFSAIVVSLSESFDGGLTWQVIQANIDLFNSPAQEVSPNLSSGAIYKLDVTTFTGGTSFSVVASSN